MNVVNAISFVALAGLSVTAAPAASPPTAQAKGLLSASHDGEILKEEVIWRSSFVLVADSVGRGAADTVTVALAWPLPDGARVELAGSESGELVRDRQGHVVALRVPSAELSWRKYRPGGSVRTLDVVVHEPTRGSGDVVLHPPFASGRRTQRVTLASTEAVRFVADARVGAERRIGFTTGADVDRDERRAADRLLEDAPGRLGAERLYLRADAVLTDAGGIPGRLETAPAKRGGLALAVGALFALLVALAFGFYRHFARAAALEHAEAVIEADYRGLG